MAKAAPSKSGSGEEEILQLLQIDNKGWNISLFEDDITIRACLCSHCGNVCKDASELGCDHEDDEICLYCKLCLQQAIEDTDYKCIINGHPDPTISPARATRRQILKSMVICPFNPKFKIKNDNNKIQQEQADANIIDTLGSEGKEGGDAPAVAAKAYNDDEKSGGKAGGDDKCGWNGSFKDLINIHIMECAKRNDPMFMMKLQIKKLKMENEDQKEIIINLERQRDDLNVKMNEASIKHKQEIDGYNVKIMKIANEAKAKLEAMDTEIVRHNKEKREKDDKIEKIQKENDEQRQRILSLQRENKLKDVVIDKLRIEVQEKQEINIGGDTMT